ncbi:hypothetical protein JCM10207_000410 [Rhodosporidiobolus poonsookiae]
MSTPTASSARQRLPLSRPHSSTFRPSFAGTPTALLPAATTSTNDGSGASDTDPDPDSAGDDGSSSDLETGGLMAETGWARARPALARGRGRGGRGGTTMRSVQKGRRGSKGEGGPHLSKRTRNVLAAVIILVLICAGAWAYYKWGDDAVEAAVVSVATMIASGAASVANEAVDGFKDVFHIG